MIAKISFANMIGDLCAHIPGADAEAVLSVLGCDRRIGRHFLRAAMPYGGPCFGRDVGALAALAGRHGTTAPLATAAEAVNAGLLDSIVGALEAATPRGGTVAVLGLAFRHGTSVDTASPALAIAARLARNGFCVNAWDPLARPAADEGVRLASSLADCLSGADTVLIANNDPRCADLPEVRRRDGGPLVVFDYWRTLDAGEAAGGFDIRHFGQS